MALEHNTNIQWSNRFGSLGYTWLFRVSEKAMARAKITFTSEYAHCVLLSWKLGINMCIRLGFIMILKSS